MSREKSGSEDCACVSVFLFVPSIPIPGSVCIRGGFVELEDLRLGGLASSMFARDPWSSACSCEGPGSTYQQRPKPPVGRAGR